MVKTLSPATPGKPRLAATADCLAPFSSQTAEANTGIDRPACSFVIGCTGEQTVQYEGHADELSGSELQRSQQIYFHTWPECRTHLSWPGIVYFVVRPRWIRYSDFDTSVPISIIWPSRWKCWAYGTKSGIK